MSKPPTEGAQPAKTKAGVSLSSLYPTIKPVDVSILPSVFLEQCSFVRRCSVRVAEARGLPKAYFAFYVEIHCDDRCVATSIIKEAPNQAPFWGEDLEVKVATTHKTLSIRVLGVEPPKTKKAGAKLTLHLLANPGDSGYSPAKPIGEVIFFLDGMDAAAGQETWHGLTSEKTGKRKGVEGADLRLCVSFEEILVLPSLLYEKLADLLLGDSTFELLVALSRADFSDVKYRAEMAEHIVHIGEARSVTAALLSKMIAVDIHQTTKRQVLFRGNTLVTKSTEYFQRFALNDWLAQFRPIIDEIMADEKNSCEVVQSKMMPDENVEENFARLQRYLDMAFSVITSFRHLCSRAMRLIFRTMMTESQKKFGSEAEGGKVGYTTVTGFLFLRLFVPAFMTPKTYGFTEGIPEGIPGRTLTLISTVLQKLANFLVFDAKDAYLDKINPWLQKKFGPLMELIDDLINDDEVTYMHIRPLDLGLSAHMACLVRLINQHAEVFDALKETSDNAATYLDLAAEILPETLAAPAIISAMKLRNLILPPPEEPPKVLSADDKTLKSISSEQSVLMMQEREQQKLRELEEQALRDQMLKEQQKERKTSRENSKKDKAIDIPQRFQGDARPGSHRGDSPVEGSRLIELKEGTDGVQKRKSITKTGSSPSSDGSPDMAKRKSRSGSTTMTHRVQRSGSNPLTEQLSDALTAIRGEKKPMPMTKPQIQDRVKEMQVSGATTSEVESFILEQAELRKKALEDMRKEKEDAAASATSSAARIDRRSKTLVKVMSKDEIKEKARVMLQNGIPNEEVVAFIKEQKELREKYKPKKEKSTGDS